MLGLWLFVSAFVWPHTTFHFWVSLVVGAMIVFDTILALFDDAGRILNWLFAIYLVLTTLTVHSVSRASVWNGVIVGIAVFVVACIGPFRPMHLTEEPR